MIQSKLVLQVPTSFTLRRLLTRLSQLRAISVLKRDLRREDERREAEERRKQADALMLPPPVPPLNTSAASDSFATPTSDPTKVDPRTSPALGTLPGRRSSAISISSLHRPQFPLKLDLSSTSLRITEEEAAVFSKGLASPVTLAPKSARALGPTDSFPDLMATFAGSSTNLEGAHVPPAMDLNIPDGIHITQKQPDLAALTAGLGDSLDKPIELDLDAMDIEMANMNDHFIGQGENSEHTHADDGLFSPALDNGEAGQQLQVQSHSVKERNDLPNFEMDTNIHDELFGDFTTNVPMELASNGTTPHQSSTSIPSPNSFLAQLSSAPDSVEGKTSSTGENLMPDSGETFDLNSLDLSHLTSGFFPDGQGSEMSFPLDMDSFLSLNTNHDSQGDDGVNNVQDQAHV